jgi:hypothetical protein
MPLAIITFTEEQPPEVKAEFAREVETGIKAFLRRNLKNPTGRLEHSIQAYVYGKHIAVDSDVPYAREVDQGKKTSEVMWNLINKVVPIKLDGGRTIFRRVTLNSILRGKWKQSPRPGLNYVDRGVEIARSRMSVRAQINVIVQKIWS